MSDQGDVQQLAEQLAGQGRRVLVEQLSSAYADAASAHADVVSIDQSRIDALVQRAADRADGLQWRRALASAASAQLGISVVDAMSHPAVAKAQELADAPSYEDGLSKLLARPIPVPSDEPLTVSDSASTTASPSTGDELGGEPAAVVPGQEELFLPVDSATADKDSDKLKTAADAADEDAQPAAPDSSSTEADSDEETYVPAEEEAAAQFTEDEVEQADAPTQTYDAAKAAGIADDPEPEAGADEDDAQEPDEDEDAPGPLAGLAKAKPVTDPHATQIHDMQAEFAAQDRARKKQAAAEVASKAAAEARAAAEVPAATDAARKPEYPKSHVRPIPTRPAAASDPDATAVHPVPEPPQAQRPTPAAPPRRPGAPARPPAQRVPEPAPLPDDDEYGDELRIAAVHLGGVANLPAHGEPLDVRISEAGLDILQANEEILGRLQWSDIGRLEAGAPKGRLLGKNKGGSRLVVRTKHGDASFEIPDMDPEELRAEVAELSARYGR